VRSRTRVLAVVAGAWSVALPAPTVVWADALTPESGGPPNADEIDSLHRGARAQTEQPLAANQRRGPLCAESVQLAFAGSSATFAVGAVVVGA